MKRMVKPRAALLLAASMLASTLAFANADVEKNIANEKNWAMQAGDMFNQRYSKLKQIDKTNAGKLQVAWTFSTGVLRGHEGFPAGRRRHDVHPHAVPEQRLRTERRRSEDRLEIRAQAGSGGHPADVLRHRLPRPGLRGRQGVPAAGRQHAGGAQRQGRQGALVGEERRSESRCRQHQCAAHLQGQGHHRHQRRRMGRARLPGGVRHQHRQAGVEGLQHRPGCGNADGPGQDDGLDRRQDGAGRQGFVAEDLAG